MSNGFVTHDGGDTKQALKRAYACFRALSEQILESTTQTSVEKIKTYVKIKACEHGYPYDIINGVAEPKSLALASKDELTIINNTINLIADQYREDLNRPLYLYQIDKFGKYKSIGGRTRDEMFKDHPDVM
jgi:hypothetical protein